MADGIGGGGLACGVRIGRGVGVLGGGIMARPGGGVGGCLRAGERWASGGGLGGLGIDGLGPTKGLV